MRAVCRGRGGAEETEMTFEVFSMSLFELADYWAPEKTESSYVRSQSRLCFLRFVVVTPFVSLPWSRLDLVRQRALCRLVAVVTLFSPLSS